MNYLGIDIGSSSIKCALADGNTLKAIGYAQSPAQELEIIAHRPGWAEQDPETWWQHVVMACQDLKAQFPKAYSEVVSIGISYQMHGLVITDAQLNVLRPSIIWCDSRAVSIGEEAFRILGKENCMVHFLNSPGNFTASKLKWVKDNEPSVYDQVRHVMLPGDYIAARLTGEVRTTFGGLSEGILWDFLNHKLAHSLLTYFDFDRALFPEAVSSFSRQGKVKADVLAELGLSAGVEVGYRAGDQANNAFSLGVMEPGQIAADAGTSGVIYGIFDTPSYDPSSRVNTFAHVNHQEEKNRLGVLACTNGAGNFYSWVRKLIGADTEYLPSYDILNALAAKVHPGCDHLKAYPFGNGAERLLNNQNPGGSFSGLNFNVHTPGHLLRATQESIVYSLYSGLEIMAEMGLRTKVVRAGHGNMFLSSLFRQIFADVTQTELQLVETTGSLGAAIGAAIGLKKMTLGDWTSNLQTTSSVSPDSKRSGWYQDLYKGWKARIDLS